MIEELSKQNIVTCDVRSAQKRICEQIEASLARGRERERKTASNFASI